MYCENCGGKMLNRFTTNSSANSAVEMILCDHCHAAIHGLVRLHREALSLAEAARRARMLRTA